MRQERQVVRLGTALHAELVVEAAVALVRQVEGDGRERLVDHAARRGALAGDEVPHRAAVGLGIGDELQQSVLHAEEIAGPRALQLPAFAVTRRRGRGVVGRSAVEDAEVHLILVDGDPGLGEERGDHLRVEGDLQPVLDLGRRRALDVGDQDLERAGGVASEAQDVDVATDVPAAEGDEQPRLEEDERLPGGEGPRLGHDPLVVSRPGIRAVEPVCIWKREVDGAETAPPRSVRPPPRTASPDWVSRGGIDCGTTP